MLLQWFDVREAAAVGSALADRFAPQPVPGAVTRTTQKAGHNAQDKALQELLRHAMREVRPLQLNVYKRAKLANSFKWRLLENGIEKQIAEEVTQALVLHLFVNQPSSATEQESSRASTQRPAGPAVATAKNLLSQGNRYFAQGAYVEAMNLYQDLVKLKPRHADALNNLGATLCKLGHYQEAEGYFRQAIEIRPTYPEAHSNLGNVRRWKGYFTQSEVSLRRALKLKPAYVDARNNLGLTLIVQGRLSDAKANFEKVLKVAPRHAGALHGMGQVAQMEGRFDQAVSLFKRALEVDPNMPGAYAALAGMRKMTSADGAWLERAEEIAASGIAPVEEADVRFAIGKYCDDVGDFKRAFQSYKRANELLRAIAENYERDVRSRFVDDLIGAYSRDTIAQVGNGISASKQPIFVLGMPRSGTSLTEQIIASHPDVKGAGEVAFWSDALREHETDLRQGLLGEPIRKKLADAYLRALVGDSGDAPRIVDKTPVNADYLGVIHSVFPNARIIYMQRDPIDTCLSCYFQQLSPGHNFTMDLSDLAHYYRQHERLMAHWRAVLPPGSILAVPYEELVADQETWTRKILDFVNLEWDERCLDFHKTERDVATASYWQVRQRIYHSSVERWRNYEKFIGPLMGLKKLDA